MWVLLQHKSLSHYHGNQKLVGRGATPTVRQRREGRHDQLDKVDRRGGRQEAGTWQGNVLGLSGTAMCLPEKGPGIQSFRA